MSRARLWWSVSVIGPTQTSVAAPRSIEPPRFLFEEIVEALEVSAEPVQRDDLVAPQLEARQALQDVGGPARLAELAVADDVEAGLGLLAHDIVDGLSQAFSNAC